MASEPIYVSYRILPFSLLSVSHEYFYLQHKSFLAITIILVLAHDTEALLSQLYKGAEEDVIQLYDMSILPQKHTAGDHRSTCGPMSSLMNKGRKESLFSLGTLLYRVAHRMSLSKVLGNCLLL